MDPRSVIEYEKVTRRDAEEVKLIEPAATHLTASLVPEEAISHPRRRANATKPRPSPVNVRGWDEWT
jgi:hypothetical protein